DTEQGTVLTSNVARVDTESFQLKIPRLRTFPLLSLYIAVISSQARQTFNEKDIVMKLFPEYENNSTFIMFYSGILFGTLITSEPLFEYGTLDFNAKRNGSVRVGQMPEKICQAVTNELIRRIETPDKEDLKTQDKLMSQKKTVDDFFDAS
ncbi:hypothetical protein KA005_41330, partial [bacterium]|nr:hypothetical protein [bacterium]